MTFISIIDTLTFYGLDVVLLALITCVITYVLKITVLKKCAKKLITLLPFIVGTILYGAYLCLQRLDFFCITSNLATIIENGFSVGTLATVFYVCYEQFIRNKPQKCLAEGVITSLIEGTVPDDAVERTAREIYVALYGDDTGDGAERVYKILLASCNSEDASNLKMLSTLIIQTLARMRTK